MKLPAFHNRSVFTVDFVSGQRPSELRMLTTGMDRLVALWGPAKESMSIMETTWRNLKVRWSFSGLGGEAMCIDGGLRGAGVLAVGCGDKTVRCGVGEGRQLMSVDQA